MVSRLQMHRYDIWGDSLCDTVPTYSMQVMTKFSNVLRFENASTLLKLRTGFHIRRQSSEVPMIELRLCHNFHASIKLVRIRANEVIETPSNAYPGVQ